MCSASSTVCITTHLVKKAGFSRKAAQTGAVTLIQRCGLERHGLLERDAENSYLAGDDLVARFVPARWRGRARG